MNLAVELQEEKVAHLDLSGFSQVPSGTTVREALNKLRAERHNICLITQGTHLLGIFTDRDVLRRVVGVEGAIDGPIDSVMTRNPITITPDAPALDALSIMDEHQFRNLPVVDSQGNVVGDMTHQAIIAYLATRYPVEVLNRPLQADRFPRRAEGG